MKLFLVTLLMHCVLAEKFVLPEKCREEFRDHKPATSCFVPYPELTVEQDKKCRDECKTKQDDRCCVFQCSVDIMQFYPSQKFSEENYRKGYKTYFDNFCKNSTIEEFWTPVLEETFKTCVELIGTGISKDENCGVTRDFEVLRDCMEQVNYMNCPEKIYENHAEAYNKTKMFVESKLRAGECGRMVKDLFLIYGIFWY